jgi:hypothetical protein
MRGEQIPTFVWAKTDGDKTTEVVLDERQFEEYTALGYAQKLDSKKKPVPGPTQEEIAAQIAEAEAAAKKA